jgi:predicted porin
LENFEMKKTLVAVAALAAFSGAYAEVTISGLLDAAVTIDGTNSTLGAGPNGGSEFTLGLNEDLGNGLKAIGAFTIIGDVFSATGDQFATYNSFVGLSGEFGSVKLGSQWSPIFLASTISDATGRWGSTNLANPAELQTANSITYTSPSISGFSLSFQRELGVAGTPAAGTAAWINTGSGTTQAYSLNYSVGGFTAAYATGTNSVGSVGNEETKTSLFAAKYDFGMAAVHYGNLTTDAAANGTNVKSNSIAVSAPIGALTLSAIYSSDGTDSAQNYQGVYALSKRTQLNASAGKMQKAGDTANNYNQYRLGIKSTF